MNNNESQMTPITSKQHALVQTLIELACSSGAINGASAIEMRQAHPAIAMSKLNDAGRCFGNGNHELRTAIKAHKHEVIQRGIGVN